MMMELLDLAAMVVRAGLIVGVCLAVYFATRGI